jgi:hypothetical protein
VAAIAVILSRTSNAAVTANISFFMVAILTGIPVPHSINRLVK